ncbi:MAG: hypothetical protein H6Q64_428, partial [Firmicutes bacterium]|nr:hypothetical protein [Bacillota bacterium]
MTKWYDFTEKAIIYIDQVPGLLREVIGLASLDDLLKSMLDVVNCPVACYQIILRDNEIDYKFVEINSAYEILSGYDRHRLLGRCLGDESLSGLFQGFDLARWIKDTARMELADSLFFISNNCYKIALHRLDEDHLISVFYDITDLHSYRHKYELVFNSTNALQSLTTFKEGEEGIYVDVNDIICSTIGLPREDIIGRSWISVNVLENPADHYRIMKMISQ